MIKNSYRSYKLIISVQTSEFFWSDFSRVSVVHWIIRRNAIYALLPSRFMTSENWFLMEQSYASVMTFACHKNIYNFQFKSNIPHFSMMFPHRWESNFTDLDVYTIVAKKYYKKSRDWSIFWKNKKEILKNVECILNSRKKEN